MKRESPPHNLTRRKLVIRRSLPQHVPTLFGTRSEGTISANEVEPQTQEKELLTTSTPPRVDHDGQVRCTLDNRPAGDYDELTIYAKTLKIQHTNSALVHNTCN